MDAFRANAEKYVSALRVFEMRDGLAVALTARPRAPKAGDLVRFYIQVGPPEKGGMIPDARAALSLRDGVAHVYRMDRAAAPAPELRRLHETEDPGTYGFSKLIEHDGEYRVYFEASYKGGQRMRVGLDCVTLGALPRDDHHDAPKPTPPSQPEQHEAHSRGELPMAVQHETMKRIGEHWLALDALVAGDWNARTRKRALDHLGEIEKWSAHMPRFALHKFQDRKDEFARLGAEFTERLGGFRRAVDGADIKDVRTLHRDLDATSCTKCHLKFRWGVAGDLSRFPDLSGQP